MLLSLDAIQTISFEDSNEVIPALPLGPALRERGDALANTPIPRTLD